LKNTNQGEKKVAKYLDKVIKEMADYSNMGMPDGDNTQGMGSVKSMGMRGGHQGKKLRVYKEINPLLRDRSQREEEEDSMEYDDMDSMNGMDDMGDMNGDMGMDDGHTEELTQFFTDNPSPSDEEIAMQADDLGLDLEGMRKAVYALIQSLLPSDEEGNGSMDVDMDMDMGDDDMAMGDDEMSSDRMSSRGMR